LVPFESLGAVFYSPSIVTMTVSVAVCEIFSAKERCDLENRVRVRSGSLEMAPFDRSYTSCYSPSIATGDILHRLRDIATYWSKIANFYTPHVFIAPARDDPIGIL